VVGMKSGRICGWKYRSSPVYFPGQVKPNNDFLLDLVLKRAEQGLKIFDDGARDALFN
jgi:hypothetical protein